MVRFLLPRSNNLKVLRIVKRSHMIIGMILTLTAFTNCYIGLRFFVEASHPLAIAYVAYILGLVLVFVVLQTRRTIANRRRTSIHSNEHKIAKRPMTYATFIQRVEHGQQLMLIDGNVYNVRDFIKKHPGGAQVRRISHIKLYAVQSNNRAIFKQLFLCTR